MREFTSFRPYVHERVYNKMDAYSNAGVKLLAFASEVLNQKFSEVQIRNFEIVFKIMAFIDHYLDYGEINKEEACDFLNLSKANDKFAPIVNIYKELKNSLSPTSFKKFQNSSIKAIRFSNALDLKSRHKEAILVGYAVTYVLDIINPDVNLLVSNFFVKGSSFGNFGDDILDMYKDKRSIFETLKRLQVALIQLRKFSNRNGGIFNFFIKMFNIFVKPKINKPSWQ